MQAILRKLSIFFCYLSAFVCGMKQLREPDIWWQLLAGRWMLENGEVTKVDIFSYTMQGQQWINVKWLYEVIIAWLERLSGPEGVMLLQAVVNVAIVYLLVKTVMHFSKQAGFVYSTFFTVIAVLLFLAINEYRMAGRPEMMSHLLSVMYLYILWRFPAKAWKHILWLIPLQCLWANMHEGYPIGMVMIGCFTAGSLISYFITHNREYFKQSGRLFLVWIGAALAILANPNGIVLWKQPFEIYRQVWANKYTTELYSFIEPDYWTIQAKLHIVVLVLVLLFWSIQLLRAVRKHRLIEMMTPALCGYLLMIPLFTYLSLTANRNIVFAQIILFPSIPLMFKSIVTQTKLRDWKYRSVVSDYAAAICAFLAITFYVGIVSNKYYEVTDSKNKYGIHINLLHNPTGAADFIEKHNIKGVAFSDYFASSYLLWRLYPEFKSYIDLRDLDVFDAEFFDDYFSMYEQPNKFYTLDSQYNFNYVVLSTSQLTGVQQKLYWGEGYNLIYVDPVSVIFLKLNEQNSHLNSNLSIQSLFTWPMANEEPGWAAMLNKLLNPNYEFEETGEDAAVYAALFYNAMGNYPMAMKLLAPALPVLNDDAKALATMGDTYLNFANMSKDMEQRKVRLDSARYFLQRALDINPDQYEAYASLANLELAFGNYEYAKEYLHEYIKRNQSNAFVYFLLGITYRGQWEKTKNITQLREMTDAMKRVEKLNPSYTKAYLYLAEGYYRTGEPEKARAYLKKAAEGGAVWTEQEKESLKMLQDNL